MTRVEDNNSLVVEEEMTDLKRQKRSSTDMQIQKINIQVNRDKSGVHDIASSPEASTPLEPVTITVPVA